MKLNRLLIIGSMYLDALPKHGNWRESASPEGKMNKALVGGTLVSLLMLFGPVSGVAAQTCIQPPSGLVSWWPGDGSADDIVGGNAGTLIGGVTFDVGLVGQAFSLDGLDDYVDASSVSADVSGSAELSFGAWAFPTTNAGLQILVAFNNPALFFNNRILLGLDGPPRPTAWRYVDGLPGLGENNNDIWFGGTSVGLDEWHHVMVTIDSSNDGKLFVDGVLQGTFVTTVRPDGSDYFSIGQEFDPYTTSDHWQGLIDEVEIYNRALSDSEVQAIFNAGSAGKCQTPTNQLPTASAGVEQLLDCGSPAGSLVTLDGSGSLDLDGDALTFRWTGPFQEGGGVVMGENPTVTLPLGTSTVTLVVNDGQADSDPDTVDITISVGVQGFLPPLDDLAPTGTPVGLPGKAFKQGRTLPLKVQLGCGATALTEADVAAPTIVGLLRGGDPIQFDILDLDAGQANDNGVAFRYSDPHWVYNFSTDDLESGTYVITIELPDGQQYDGGFVLR